MSEFLSNPLTLLVGVGVVIVLWTVALKPHAQNASASAASKWLAFALAVLCGLILGTVLFNVMHWLTGLTGGLGGFVGSIGSIIALFFGWQAVYMIVGAARDLADKEPDKEAQRAALWVPTLLPAGGSAVWAVVSNPRGIGSGLAAAIMAVITIVQCVRINKAALNSKNHQANWRYFAAGVSILAGLVAIPLTAYADDALAGFLSGNVMAGLRILGGALGVALLVAGLADFLKKDREGKRSPDQHVRRAGFAGIPLAVVLGAGAIAWLAGSTSSGLDIMQGVLS